MKNNQYLNDIAEIKNMMNKSSRFISLSGLSGVLAGIYALIGAILAYQSLYKSADFSIPQNIVLTENQIFRVIGIAAVIVVFSVVTAISLSAKKARREGEKIWDASSKRLIINFTIPLLTGGILILYLIEKEMWSLVVPLMLVFYGLACVNASKYTLGDVRYLGITVILLGLVSLWFVNYGLIFWAIGFGLGNIFYGLLMYFKYERTAVNQ
ncbi:hypothetical protein GV828_02725 [Flavobacterium sp. NST-5]|uniref:Beta-carotene 15,15'-monooxygenase n=1 Tax=Flavobacterium ichthyis TaxID=2698827 RepID=A0ABW9ZAJ3_9FLAO|nr:hypothetical protein [Flavobacterium ichthyis]NBL64110.1 hypothetical protein [Flavobacterium ichthyis]